MAQKKKVRFAEIATFRNVLQYPLGMPGKWIEFFRNANPITLELACGKGEYTVGLAMLNPDRNFIGMDIKGNRIWVGAKNALASGLDNAAFVRSQIEKIPDYFATGEVEQIWITFPDPHLRLSRAKKRLTHPRFLRLFKQILREGGYVHLKTDSPELYHFTKLVIEQYQLSMVHDCEDISNLTTTVPELSIRTHYEGLDISGSRKVHYICFRIDKDLPVENDRPFNEFLKRWEQPGREKEIHG